MIYSQTIRVDLIFLGAFYLSLSSFYHLVRCSMKPDFFVIFPNQMDCEETIARIASEAKLDWGRPITNAFDSRCAIPWIRSMLPNLDHFIDGRKTLTEDALVKQDFNHGFHTGPFAQASRKLEEAQLIVSDFPTILELLHFPLFRSVFYASQGALYGTREAIEKKTQKVSAEAFAWWKATWQRAKVEHPLIYHLNVDYNRDKHGDASSILEPTLKSFGYRGERADIISGEGAFVYSTTANGRWARSFVSGLNGVLDVQIVANSYLVSGVDVQGLTITQQMQKIIDVHDTWIFEAEKRFG